MKKYRVVSPVRFGLFVVVCSLVFWLFVGACFEQAQERQGKQAAPYGASWDNNQWQEYINK